MLLRLVAVLFVLVLAACGGSPASTTEADIQAAVDATIAARNRAQATEAARASGTGETQVIEIEATATVAAPAGAAVSTQSVIDAFKAAGLEAENTHAMTLADYDVAPFPREGTRFFIPSLDEDSGGRVMRYESVADAELAKRGYDERGQARAMLFSWAFIKGDIVVHINGTLPEEQARKYEAALQGMP